MKEANEPTSAKEAAALLKSELVKGLASDLSKRTLAQIRTDFRKAREAA